MSASHIAASIAAAMPIAMSASAVAAWLLYGALARFMLNGGRPRPKQRPKVRGCKRVPILKEKPL